MNGTVPGREPNLIVAGTNKAGTTSLYYHLAAHPGICASRIKETGFFDRWEIEKGLAGLDTYRAHFSHCGDQSWIMESTPSYFSGGRLVAETIREYLGGIRIILSFRNPIDRLFSLYRSQKGVFRIDRNLSFAEYVEVCLSGTRRAESWVYGPGSIEYGYYDQVFPAWIEIFGSTLKVLFFEHLISDPQASLTDICTWLALDPGPLMDRSFRNENPSLAFRSAALHQLASRFTNQRPGRRVRLPQGVKRRLRSLYERLNGRVLDESLDDYPEVVTHLTGIFEPHNREFAGQLREYDPGLDLPGWLTSSDRTGEGGEDRPVSA